MQRKGMHDAGMVRMQTGAATAEDSLELPQNITNRTIT